MKKNWGRLLITFFCSFLFATSLNGCATLTTGSSQAITVNTNPTGAICTLAREGATIAIVNPTPGTVNISKDKDTISVICKKDGFQDGTETLSSEFQGMTFGNILFGGLTGVLIDAASGAMRKYQPMLAMTLIPNKFNSMVDRDTFFETMKTECISECSQTIERISNTCPDDQKDLCASQIKAAEAAKEKRLAEIDKMRNYAKIQN